MPMQLKPTYAGKFMAHECHSLKCATFLYIVPQSPALHLRKWLSESWITQSPL